MAEEISLYVRGQIFKGWKTANVKKGLQSLCGSFDLSVQDRFSAQENAWQFSPGDSCELRIGADPVISGFIDDVAPSISATDRSIKVNGRDKTADLVDCAAAAAGPGPWSNITLDGLARVLAKPYGIVVKNNAGNLARFDSWALSSGGSESAFEALDRAAKQRGVLLISDNSGALVLAKPNLGRLPTAIVEGQNFLGGSSNFTARDRFSEYRVQGSSFGEASADFTTGQLKVVAVAKDAGISRFRVMLVQGDGSMDASRAQSRAQWEASIRAARSVKCSVSVPGWRHGGKGLWLPNYEVRATIPSLFIDADLLISEVTYSISDDGGEVTTMELVRKDAFKPEPTKPAEQDGWKKLIETHK